MTSVIIFYIDAHSNIDIGCQNLQENEFLQEPVEFQETLRQTVVKPVIAVATNDHSSGPPIPKRFSIAQKFEIETRREMRKSQLEGSRSHIVFRKTAFGQAPGLPDRRSTRFVAPGLPDRKSTRFKRPEQLEEFTQNIDRARSSGR